MKWLLRIIFLYFTIVAFIGLIPTFGALLFSTTDTSETYGPLNIANPPLAMLIVWGAICLVLLTITIKLFRD